MQTVFCLDLLGVPQITFQGQPVRGFYSRKVLALVCYLAVHAQPVSRTHLADLFWGTMPEAQGRANLSRVLNNLTARLPNSVRATRDTLALEDGMFVLDLREFEAFARQPALDALESAAALYRGEFMAETYLDDCPEFEVWMVGERERWQRRVISVLESLAAHYARGGDTARALSSAARLLDLAPWHEGAHREMMRLLARTGKRGAALQQYETARRVLAKELGVEPDAETTALYQQIRAQKIASTLRAAPTALRPTNLLPPLTAFIGRETELARITARLNNPDCRLLTLVGTGGVGKTRLAVQVAHTMHDSFPEGVYFIPLASIGARQCDLIVPTIMSALNLRFSPQVEPRLQLLDVLRDKRMLLLLDNFEHLLDGAALVVEILHAAPQVKILATSREPLAVQAEWLMRVEGLSFPTTGFEDKNAVSHYSAVQLFVERASRIDERFTLTETAGVNIARICAAVEGLPLAVELAAAMTKTLRPDEIAEQIVENNTELTTTLRDFEARHRSLSAVLDWSYNLLTEAEQVLFRRLAVFAWGWTRQAAEQVCADAPIPAKEDAETRARSSALVDSLNRLVDHSLVLKREERGIVRYRMLEPVRQYAWRKLSADEADAIRTRHLYFFLWFVEASASELKSPQSGQRLERLAIENMNLRAALAWALTNRRDAEAGLRFAGALWRFWWMHGLSGEGRGWLKQALELAPTNVSPARAKAFYAQGHLCYFQGDYAAARELYVQSIALSEQLDQDAYRAAALNGLGNVLFMFGDYAGARRVYEQGLALRRELGDLWSIANSLLNVTEVARAQGDFELARAALEECLQINRALGDRRGMAFVLLNLTDDLLIQRDLPAAANAQAECLALFQELGDRWGTAHALKAGGDVASARQDRRAAISAYRSSLTLFNEMGEQQGMARILLRLALMTVDVAPERAARLLSAAELLRQTIGLNYVPSDQADYERNLARTRAALTDAAFAQAWAEGQAMSVAEAVAYALESDSASAE